MNYIKHTLKLVSLTALFVAVVLPVCVVSADHTVDHCKTTGGPPTVLQDCISKVPSAASKPLDVDCEVTPLDKGNCDIIKHLVNGINFLTAAAGMVIVFSIMYAGYEYMTARDNSGQIQKARMRIIWALVALLIMLFMYAFLNWVVPGGVL